MLGPSILLRPKLSTAFFLSIAFASLFIAVGPGRFFTVDEVVVQEMAEAVYSRGNLEVPSMNTAVAGRGGAYYAHRGPALGYVAIPFVILGDILDNNVGSMLGGIAAGPPVGTLEHPLRWGGRLSIFTALAANAVIGGLAVGMLYLIALRMSGDNARAALLVASAGGIATLLASESTHFFQHPLETLTLLLTFWFLLCSKEPLYRRALMAGLSAGLAILTRPNAAPAAAVICLCGAIKTWRESVPETRRSLAKAVALLLAPLVLCAALYLVYNDWQFGEQLNFGYLVAPAQQTISVNSLKARATGIVLFDVLKATAAYIASPSLSIFLYAPPLILFPFFLRTLVRRWPFETMTILLVSAAHFAGIVFFGVWHGELAYGPRYMLAPMVLLMLLTIPAFERAAAGRPLWQIAAGVTTAIGLAVQAIGVSVYVVVNEWYRVQHNMIDNAAYVFTASASPVWIQLKDLLAGRNITMWAVRALPHEGGASLILAILLVLAAFSAWNAFRHVKGELHSQLPAAAALGIAALIVLGFAGTSPIRTPPDQRASRLASAGLQAQQAGLSVRAEELYAIVLGLDARNTDALTNLALLYDKFGMTTEAEATRRKIAGSDCLDAKACYEAGKRLLAEKDLAAALNVWEQASQRFPNEASLIRDLAWGRYQFGDYDAAIRDYTKALELSPADNNIRTDLAWALLRAGRLDQARSMCNQVLSTEGQNAAARAILAQLTER